LTRAGTARQKLQRATAQEFLCPIEGLKSRLGLPYPDDEELAEAAEHYQVSALVVSNALVNKKLVDRDFRFQLASWPSVTT
jgi:Zn-dependent peptidase ImmA (M78 family)